MGAVFKRSSNHRPLSTDWSAAFPLRWSMNGNWQPASRSRMERIPARSRLSRTACGDSCSIHRRNPSVSRWDGRSMTIRSMSQLLEGQSEYKRVMDATSTFGLRNLLYAPANHDLSEIANDADDWNWEHVLWLGLGQQIRAGKWDPEKSAHSRKRYDDAGLRQVQTYWATRVCISVFAVRSESSLAGFGSEKGSRKIPMPHLLRGNFRTS